MFPKMKICHVSEATSGGVLTHLIQLAKGLDRDLFQQTFVLSSIKNPKLKYENDFRGNKLIIINIVRNISFFRDLISLIMLIWFFKKNKFDVIHCHSSKAGVLGRIAGILTRHKKIIYTPHAFSFNDFNPKIKNLVYAFIERFMARITTKIVCVSKGEYREALKYNIASEKSLVIIPNGVEEIIPDYKLNKIKWLKDLGGIGSEKIIGFVGRIDEQKNPEMFIRAINEMVDNNFMAIIMGKGPLTEEINELIKSLNIAHKVKFLGEVENVKEYLHCFDIFVSTSLWEGMPYAILEAMSAEIPVVATKIPGTMDLIIDGQTGLLVPAKNYIILKDTLDKLLNDTVSQQFLSNNAKKLVTEYYTITNMVNMIEEVYLGED
ncbi:glycosyltransferase family 4 protein [Paenibacillus rigui]|uniref:Glycosyltransferase family 1 protein n=1 Tax=Paenibacillus rigui TaxID=554312 RepID=A0A229UUD1_9BACL|nr:glycosyltransferase family 4 protein [Paenibacillus rigui]OXM86519.1 hypothetical protein CF651_10130 [Paenibacillus rigui]